MEPTNQGEVPKLSQVIQIDEGKIQEHLGEVVRSTVEETLNAMLDAEADRLCRSRSNQRLRCIHSSLLCYWVQQGGTTPMMGQHSRTESLFYYFRLEEQIPADHLLRMIDGHVDFSFVREQLKDSYSPTGRPSIDPEVLLRLLLVGYLYGITSERRLMDEVRMHLAYRWFTRLDFEQEIPDHSTFSENRPGRFRQCGVFRYLRRSCAVV